MIRASEVNSAELYAKLTYRLTVSGSVPTGPGVTVTPRNSRESGRVQRGSNPQTMSLVLTGAAHATDDAAASHIDTNKSLVDVRITICLPSVMPRSMR